MQKTKTQLEGDYEIVRQRLADKELEIVESEQALTFEQERDRANIGRRRELMERIDMMSNKSLVLEHHQQEVTLIITIFVDGERNLQLYRGE